MGIFTRNKQIETRSHDGPSFSVGDPALAEYLGIGGRTDAGVSVTEGSALGLTAVYRSVALIAGSIAQLPLKTYRRNEDNDRQHVPSFMDNAGGSYLTPYEFKELMMVHLLLHGNAYLLHIYNGAGGLDSLFPIHPGLVSVEADPVYGRVYKVNGEDGREREYTAETLTHVIGLGTTGLVGLSPIQACRNAVGTGIAGDQAAARMFSSGMLLGGIVSSDEELTEEQADTIKHGLKAKFSGSKNAGDIAVVNASLKFSPWTMTSEDAQFIESRAFQIEEVSRIFGVPPHLLSQTEKQTSWGTGVAEQNRGLSVFTLAPWTSRIEQRLSRLLPRPRYVEFDHAGFLAPSPEQEIPLLIQQVQSGLLTLNEARARMNLPPLTEAIASESLPTEAN